MLHGYTWQSLGNQAREFKADLKVLWGGHVAPEIELWSLALCRQVMHIPDSSHFRKPTENNFKWPFSENQEVFPNLRGILDVI